MKKPAKVISLVKYIALLIVVLFTLFFLALMSSLFISEDSIPHQAKSEKMGIFTRYNNKIYALVPSNGDYLIKEADPETFKPLPNTKNYYNNRQFAIDKNHAYCGNLVIPELNPQKTKALGNNYFSDGSNTYYCAPTSHINDDLNILEEVWQTMLYKFGFANKPQSYIYTLKKIPQSRYAYFPQLDADILSDGQISFYQGEALDQVRPHSLRQLSKVYADSDTRLSYHYFADDKHVYYKHHKLAIEDNPQLQVLNIDSQNQQDYLFDPVTGRVFVKDIAFDQKFAPYKVLSLHGAHINHALFISQNGVFYYDTQEKQVLRADDNPFTSGKIDEIAPLIFQDGQRILFAEAKEAWGNGRHRGLISRSTIIYRLDEPTTGHWERVAMAYHNKGQIWKNGTQYYYFDALGNGQLIRQTIYKIQNQKTLAALQNPELRLDDIRKFIQDNQLSEVKKSPILEAKTQYSKNKFGIIPILIGVTLFVLAVLWILDKFQRPPNPFYIEKQKLKLNRLFPKSFNLADIDCIIFNIEQHPKRSCAIALFCIKTKDGKTSRKYSLSSAVRLRPESTTELKGHILELQENLKAHDVHSTFLSKPVP